MVAPCGHCPDHVELASDIAVIKAGVKRLEKLADDKKERDDQFAIDIALLKHDAVEEGGKAGRRGGTKVAALVAGGIMGLVQFIKWMWGAA